MHQGDQFIDKDNFVNAARGKTRGHSQKVQKAIGRKDIKKYSFPYRAIEEWNRLPPEVVEATSIGNFN